MRPDRNSVLNIHETQRTKFLTRMHLGLSHVNDHKFRHNFQDCIITIGSCRHNILTTTHFLLHCPHYTCARQTLFNKIKNLDLNIFGRKESSITNVHLVGNKNLNPYINKSIIMSTIEQKV